MRCFGMSASSRRDFALDDVSARFFLWYRLVSYNARVTAPRRYYGLNDLHFITASTYRRARLFDSKRFRQNFAKTLAALPLRFEFKIFGYVLMPEHFHLLIWPSREADPSKILKSLKGRTAKFILRNLLDNRELPWCRQMLSKSRLPPSVHDESHYRIWQRRFYDINVWTERKRLEKLSYMHGNPVKRGLVVSPENGLIRASGFITLRMLRSW